jgi:hypothetical protein
LRRIEHGAIKASDRYPSDPKGRGIHPIAGFNAVLNEAARLAIAQTSADRNRVVEQIGGDVPGLYAADGSGGWLYLGGFDIIGAYSLAQHAERHRAMGEDPILVGLYSATVDVAVRDMVYISGSYAVDRADNSVPGRAPIIGAAIAKPTSTSAIVTYFGVIDGYSGLTAGADIFLGTNGGIIEPPLPTTLGLVMQKVGQALSDTALLLDPEQPIAL